MRGLAWGSISYRSNCSCLIWPRGCHVEIDDDELGKMLAFYQTVIFTFLLYM